MKILVATDGSEFSLRAIDGIHRHVSWFREQPTITLITVHAPLPSKRAAAWVGKQVLDDYYDEECEEALAPARKRLDELGLAYNAVKKVGEVAHEIAEYVAHAEVDLIAMGTHGRTGLKNLVMGSIATKVLHAATVPVLFFK